MSMAALMIVVSSLSFCTAIMLDVVSIAILKTLRPLATKSHHAMTARWQTIWTGDKRCGYLAGIVLTLDSISLRNRHGCAVFQMSIRKPLTITF